MSKNDKKWPKMTKNKTLPWVTLRKERIRNTNQNTNQNTNITNERTNELKNSIRKFMHFIILKAY